MMTLLSNLLVLTALATSSIAHPGATLKEHAQDVADRTAFLNRDPRSVRDCAAVLERRGYISDAIARRQEFARKVRAQRGLEKIKAQQFIRRDFSKYNISHESNSTYTLGDNEDLLFSDDSSCVLQPEVTQGPYYIDGETFRSNMTEDQNGVPLYLDVQVVDTSTCEPIPAVFVDAWHCNATGVYSGVVANGNGNADDKSNINKTFTRGLQLTDSYGVVQFETIFPGHYTGRATHIHVLTHNANSTIVRTNSTILGSNFTTHASHVGQIFFDQSLISKVEATLPYSSNSQNFTSNSNDSILVAETADMDPFVEYVLLNQNDITDGILAWIRLGIDPATDNSISSAGTLLATGGEANSNGGMGNGNGPPPA